MDWNLLGVLASWIAVGVAFLALVRTQRDQRLKNTFELFQGIQPLLDALRTINIQEARDQILDCYRDRKRIPPGSPGALLLSFLDALEFLAFAAFNGGADLRLAVRHLRSFLPRVVTARYIERLQAEYGPGGSEVYCELHELLLIVEGNNPAYHARQR